MRLMNCATWGLTAALLAFWATDASAYQRYNDGCQKCHGDFTGGMSPKGSVFPSNNKHAMHKDSSSMGTACGLCHTSGDGRDPYIGSSDGTANNPGLGCVGCHGRFEDAGNDLASAGLGAGLRQHHVRAGVPSCDICHTDATSAAFVPVGEQITPPYYGTADTNVDDPCNPLAQPNTNENWTPGDTVGLDNDGDNLYDQDDPDCAVNLPPLAEPNGGYFGMVGEEVMVDAAGSIDDDGTIVAYDWDFGDGTTGSGLTSSHVYAAAGLYTVSLTVTDNEGATDTATTTATINMPANLPPLAVLNGPYSAMVGEEVMVDATGSIDGDGTIVAYDWDFGDGTTGSGLNASHVYAMPGVYTISLTVTDNEGATDMATTKAAIEDLPQLSVLDLDITRIRVTKRVSLRRPKPIRISVGIRNAGTVDGSAAANVVGIQDGLEVYNEVMEVSDPVGNGRSSFEFPAYTPSAVGDIVWMVIVEDEDLDIDEAMATTTVVR